MRTRRRNGPWLMDSFSSGLGGGVEEEEGAGGGEEAEEEEGGVASGVVWWRTMGAGRGAAAGSCGRGGGCVVCVRERGGSVWVVGSGVWFVVDMRRCCQRLASPIHQTMRPFSGRVFPFSIRVAVFFFQEGTARAT